nr:hypothetical protein [uncultured Aggregatibacter sp.]
MNVEKLLESSHALQSKKKIIVFKDKRNPQTLSFHNSNEMCVIEVFVDGGLITSEQSKCDFFLYVSDPSYKECREHYIELKGTDLEHAIKQISETIQFVVTNYNSTLNTSRKGYVVCNRYPKADTKFQVCQAKMRKNFNLELKVQSRKCDVNI